MYLIMTIENEPFIALELDFSGKFSVDMRVLYLETFAETVEEEYEREIAGRDVQFYYERMSSMNCLMLTQRDMDEFETKIQVKRAIRKRKEKENRLRQAS